MVFRLRGITLPDEVERDLYVDRGRIRLEPSRNAETLVAGGWLVPGLVDMHTHPGAEKPGDPFNEDIFRQHVLAHRDAGVLAIRCPGLVQRLPDHLRDESFPRLITAGHWLAAPGGFFEGWGRETPLGELPDVAEEEADAADG